MFDYANTDVESRSIFFRRLLPLLDLGRERDEIDLSKVILTHHNRIRHGTERFSFISRPVLLRLVSLGDFTPA